MNKNTFAENMEELVNKSNSAISILSGMTDSLVADSESVTVKVDDSSIIIPSYNNILNRIKVVEDTVSAITTGNGTITLADGTNRNITVDTLMQVPSKIENVANVTTFDVNSNWFFEDLMFPKIIVKLNLKDKIDDNSDRVVVKRIILDIKGNLENVTRDFYRYNIENRNLTYADALNLITSNKDIQYYEDEQIINLPLYEVKYIGDFTIKGIETVNGNNWYYLDDLYYGSFDSQLQTVTKNIRLTNGDVLKFNESLYTVTEVDEKNNRIRIKSTLGFNYPGVANQMSIYNDPFADKFIEIPIGYNEINCIFLKGVNEKYNTISHEWSNCISFVSNDLSYSDDSNMNLSMYYNTYVADFGANFIAQAKERVINNYNGKTPNAPTLNVDDFSVVQINTQINSALNINTIKTTQSSILNLKSKIKTLKNTISKQKFDLVNITDANSRLQQLNLITENSNNLRSLTTEYSTNVDYLNAFILDNKIVKTSPKYRIRGFFDIPDAQYSFTDGDIKVGKQEIIGFDIAYRYLKLDNTGVELTTYNYVDKNNNQITATFSDWTTYRSKIRQRRYDAETDSYQWEVENVGDGSEININQIDIPITAGEKVEFKVRSISEAGYPTNPLLSNWSNSVIIEFPENISATNQIDNIIDDVNAELTSIKLDETMRAAGFSSHIDDEYSSPVDNVTYHHNAANIMYQALDDSGVYKTTSLSNYINVLLDKIKTLENKISALEKNS
jgi:hypothetical protein